MAEGRDAQVEGKTSSLGGGGRNPGLWIIPIHPPLPGLPAGFLHHCHHHCPRTTPSPVTSRWPEGQRTGKSHWKDICWLTEPLRRGRTRCAWWFPHNTLSSLRPHLALGLVAFLQSSPASSVRIRPLFVGNIFWLLLLRFHPCLSPPGLFSLLPLYLVLPFLSDPSCFSPLLTQQMRAKSAAEKGVPVPVWSLTVSEERLASPLPAAQYHSERPEV